MHKWSACSGFKSFKSTNLTLPFHSFHTEQAWDGVQTFTHSSGVHHSLWKAYARVDLLKSATHKVSMSCGYTAYVLPVCIITRSPF